jgi:hypothetical protein
MMNRKLAIVLGIVGALILVCIAMLVLGSVISKERNNQDQEFADMMNVCRGQSVASAAAYESGGQNSIIAFEPNVSGDLTTYTYAVPDDMLATTAGEVALVLCLGEEKEVLLESCPYYSVDDEEQAIENVIERYVRERSAKLIVAQTGEVLADDVIQGEEPDECLDEEAFREGQDVIERKGDEISSGELREWILQVLASS